MNARTLVVIPTYNELESLPKLLARLHHTVPDADVLVVDDASPDGTGKWADEQAETYAWLHVRHRAGKLGLGTAYLEGFTWGVEHDYQILVEIDADGSHRPEQLPRLLKALGDGADLVIGSRWVRGGRLVDWPLHRELLSRGANIYTRLLLGLGVRDATGGFRAYRASILARLHLETVEAHGYAFQIDMTRRVRRAGGKIVEVPITFVERALGTSKMSRAIVVEAMWLVTKWGAQRFIECARKRPRAD